MTAMMAMMTITSIMVTVMMMEMMLRMTHGSGLPAGVCRIIHSLLPLTLATPVRHIVYTNWCIAVPTNIHLYQPIAKQSKAIPTITKRKIVVPKNIFKRLISNVYKHLSKKYLGSSSHLFTTYRIEQFGQTKT